MTGIFDKESGKKLNILNCPHDQLTATFDKFSIIKLDPLVSLDCYYNNLMGTFDRNLEKELYDII